MKLYCHSGNIRPHHTENAFSVPVYIISDDRRYYTGSGDIDLALTGIALDSPQLTNYIIDAILAYSNDVISTFFLENYQEVITFTRSDILYESIANAGKTDITYAELVIAIGNSALIRGVYYCITDYQTKHQIPNTSDINIGAIEPITVMAISENILARQVYSITYPQDIIEYDVNNSLCEDGITLRPGLIIYRKDTTYDVEMYYDWRAWKFRRYQLLVSNYIWSDISTYIISNMVTYNNHLYFCYKAVTIPGTSPDSDQVHWADIADLTNNPCRWIYGAVIDSVSLVLDTVYVDYYTSGTETYSSVRCGVGSIDNVFFQAMYNITIGNSCNGNTFGADSHNIILGDNCQFNSMCGVGSYFNSIGYGSLNNTFGDNCYSNTFGSTCFDNVFGSNFVSNSTKEGFALNVFGNACFSNIFGMNCTNNILSGGSGYNIFGGGCVSNILGSIFWGNVFGNSCQSNIFGRDCTCNIIGNNFNNNNFGDTTCYNNFGSSIFYLDASAISIYAAIFETGIYDFTGIDLSGATILPGLYNKTIFLNVGGNPRLRYFAVLLDHLVVTDINT